MNEKNFCDRMKVVSSSIIENEEVSSVKAGYVSSGKYKDEDTLVGILSMAYVQRGEDVINLTKHDHNGRLWCKKVLDENQAIDDLLTRNTIHPLDAVANPHRIQEFIALVLTLLVGALSGAIASLAVGHYILGLF